MPSEPICACGCGKPFSGRGQYKRGHYPRSTPSPADRFWQKVEVTGFCWEWTANRSGSGHGKFSVSRTARVQAHRYAYEFLVGTIPDGLVIDHLCRNPGCVNPDHMELVTPSENVLRGYGVTAVNARKTVCDNGHDLSDAYIRPNGHRTCKTCRTEWDHARRALIAAAIRADDREETDHG